MMTEGDQSTRMGSSPELLPYVRSSTGAKFSDRVEVNTTSEDASSDCPTYDKLFKNESETARQLKQTPLSDDDNCDQDLK